MVQHSAPLLTRQPGADANFLLAALAPIGAVSELGRSEPTGEAAGPVPYNMAIYHDLPPVPCNTSTSTSPPALLLSSARVPFDFPLGEGSQDSPFFTRPVVLISELEHDNASDASSVTGAIAASAPGLAPGAPGGALVPRIKVGVMGGSGDAVVLRLPPQSSDASATTVRTHAFERVVFVLRHAADRVSELSETSDLMRGIKLEGYSLKWADDNSSLDLCEEGSAPQHQADFVVDEDVDHSETEFSGKEAPVDEAELGDLVPGEELDGLIGDWEKLRLETGELREQVYDSTMSLERMRTTNAAFSEMLSAFDSDSINEEKPDGGGLKRERSETSEVWDIVHPSKQSSERSSARASPTQEHYQCAKLRELIAAEKMERRALMQAYRANDELLKELRLSNQRLLEQVERLKHAREKKRLDDLATSLTE